jgi:hypothetical protein
MEFSIGQKVSGTTPGRESSRKALRAKSPVR